MTSMRRSATIISNSGAREDPGIPLALMKSRGRKKGAGVFT
jgi:hypothetical protein